MSIEKPISYLASNSAEKVELSSTLYSRIIRGELVESDAQALYDFLKSTNNPIPLERIEDWINGIPDTHLENITSLLKK